MFLTRTSNIDYLQCVTGLGNEGVQKLTALPYLHFRKGPAVSSRAELSYLAGAKQGVLWAAEHFRNSVDSPEKFAGFLREYAAQSVYANEQGSVTKIPDFRDRTYARDRVLIPDYLIEGFNRILSQLGQPCIDVTRPGRLLMDSAAGHEYEAWNDQSQRPLTEIIEDLRFKAQQAMRAVEIGSDASITRAIEFLQTMETSWLWQFANHSRSMNLYNALNAVLKEKTSQAVILPHGVIDMAAFCMDEAQFQAYIRYCQGIGLKTI